MKNGLHIQYRGYCLLISFSADSAILLNTFRFIKLIVIF